MTDQATELRAAITGDWDELSTLCSTPRDPHELSWRWRIRDKNEQMAAVFLIETGAPIDPPLILDDDPSDPSVMFASLAANRARVSAGLSVPL